MDSFWLDKCELHRIKNGYIGIWKGKRVAGSPFFFFFFLGKWWEWSIRLLMPLVLEMDSIINYWRTIVFFYFSQQQASWILCLENVADIIFNRLCYKGYKLVLWHSWWTKLLMDARVSVFIYLFIYFIVTSKIDFYARKGWRYHCRPTKL